MNAKDVTYWHNQIEACKKYMEPKHRLWKRLLKAYALEFSNLQLGKVTPRKVSRFYPLTRQIMASVTFKYPEVFFQVEDSNLEFAAEIYQRTANSAFDQMNVMQEVRQQTFDSLFCYVGWLKMGHNPPGDDNISPYIANDAMAEDMPFVRRISPFNIFVDPNCPPQGLAYAEYVIEKMLVPLEFVKNDPRFEHRNNIMAMSVEDDEDNSMLSDISGSPMGDGDELEALKESVGNRKMVLLWEIHDRTHRKRHTFAQGVRQPIESIDHPFLDGETETAGQDPETGRPLLTGNFNPTGGYIVRGGFPYIPLRMDMPGEAFYGLPPMAYVEDSQLVITESVSRRVDHVKRGARIILGRRQERERNEGIEDRIREGEDGIVAGVEDPASAFRGMPMDSLPPDQLGLESDMRNYEEQILQVSQMALGGGPARTATESSLIAGFGQLNREWMQSAIADVFKAVAHNTLRIMADERYTPENFLINMGKDENDPIIEAVTADLFKSRFKIHVVPGSMQPLTEQLEREETLALVNYLIQLPEVNREEVVRMILRSFRVPNQEKILGQAVNEEAVRAAQLENQTMIASTMMGNATPAEVLPNQNHRVHLQTHPTIMQSQEMQQVPPQLQQQIIQMVQAHMQEHQQAIQQKAGGKPVQSMSDQARAGSNGNSAMGMAEGTINKVRSDAQKVSQRGAVTNPDQN